MPAQSSAAGDGAHNKLAGGSAQDSVPFIAGMDLAWVVYHFTFRLLCTILPRRVVYRLTEPLFQLRFRSLRHLAADRLKLCGKLAIPPDQVSKTARLCISRLAASEIDHMLLLNPSFNEHVRCESIQGIEYLDRALTSGTGVVLLTVHLAATRLARRLLTKRGYPILTVRKRFELPRSASWFRRNFIYPRCLELQPAVIGEVAYVQEPDCALQVFKRLRSGGIVNIPLDGMWGSGHVRFRLLDEPWHFPQGYFDLIRLSGCTVIPMLCSGNGASLRIQFFEPVNLVQAENAAEFIAANLPQLVQIIEGHIQQNPADWLRWIQRAHA